jgi:hypothetical protein
MTIERLATEWQRIGRPRRGRYGLTASSTHQYWLDQPDWLLLSGDPSSTSTRTARAGSTTAHQ